MDRRITIRIPGNLVAQLAALADSRSCSLSALARQLLERGLAPQRSACHDGGASCVDAVIRQCGPKAEAWVRGESDRLEVAPALVITGALYWAMEEQAGASRLPVGETPGGRQTHLIVSTEAVDIRGTAGS